MWVPNGHLPTKENHLCKIKPLSQRNPEIQRKPYIMQMDKGEIKTGTGCLRSWSELLQIKAEIPVKRKKDILTSFKIPVRSVPSIVGLCISLPYGVG